MSLERKRGTKLVQSRRRNPPEEQDDGESGPAIIDDSASEANSDEDLQLSDSDNDEEEDEDESLPSPRVLNSRQKTKDNSKGSGPTFTTENYRLQNETLQGNDLVDLGASNGVGPGKVSDTTIMLNGFKDIPNEEGHVTEEIPLQFDELDDSISFEPRSSSHKNTPLSASSTRGMSSSRGTSRDRPDRETYWQRRNREKEEYKKRLEDPTFTPYVGEFFMHDSRKRRPFDSLNQFGGPRGRGRGRGGFRGNAQNDTMARNDPSREEALWGHDGFEELEPRQSSKAATSKTKTKSQTSSVGRQTPQLIDANTAPGTGPQSPLVVKPQEPQHHPTRPVKNHHSNLISLTSTHISINISLPNTKAVVKDITLNSYVGRAPYQKALRGDRPVKISSIEGAGNREIYPAKERSWLPYFLKNIANASQAREGVHSRGGSLVSPETPNSGRNATTNLGSAPTFTPQSPAPGVNDEDDKPTKIKVNLPAANTTSSASPAISDSSSVHVHHPRPTKHINIADIDDSSARLKAFLNPQTSSSPAYSHGRTSSTQLPETAVHAAPFQPSSFFPTHQQQPHPQQIPATFGPNIPFYYPTFAALPTDYPIPPNPQNPYLVQQPRFESNGMVYYYDPAFYYFQPQPGTPSQQQSQPQPQQQQPSDHEPDGTSTSYYYPPSQIPVTDPQRAAAMGMYFPTYQQGT